MQNFLIDGIIGLDITPLDISHFLNSANGEDITIQINSPGGLLYDAISIYNLLKSYQGKITCEIIGLAASSASFISTAADEVIAYPNSIYMIHNPWLVSVGDHNKLRKDADHIEKLANFLLNAYSIKSGKSIDELKELLNSETYFFGSDIVFNKFADKILFNESSDTISDEYKNALISAAKDSVDLAYNKLNESVLASIDFTNAIEILPTPSYDAPSQLPENPHGSSAASTTASQVSAPSVDNKILFDKISSIESTLNSFIDKFNPIIEAFLPDPDDVPPSDDDLGLEPERELLPSRQAGEPKFSLPLEFFDYRLNALLDSNKILPSHKKIILDLITEINSSATQHSSNNPENIYQLLINLINVPNVSPSSPLPNPKSDAGALEPELEPELELKLEHLSPGLDIDPLSREYHKQILAIQKEHKCSYITAATIFINSRKD